jgi:glycosyltransferase involved in cell wall biosynthesis
MKKSVKILFIASHRVNRAPGQRFRFEQYIKFLEENNFECKISPLLSEADDKLLYKKGKYFQKLLLTVKCFYRRMQDVRQAKNYDIVFLFREAFFLGTTYFEKQFSKKSKLVFDFDDAIWHLDVSDANKKFGWLKNPGKTATIISMSDLVIGGNAYLADYAKHHNDHVTVIPTTIDTDEYVKPDVKKSNGTICIGWSGSITTIKHFESALSFLKKLKSKYGEKILIKVIGDSSYENSELGIKGLAWSKESELRELSSFDIGIMPLPDDEWAKGKCGLKGLQYMALEIPTLMSPVGVNSEIINDGVNGFLAMQENEWVEKISLLVESAELRKKMGSEARKTVVEKYSVNSQQEKYLSCLRGLLY